MFFQCSNMDAKLLSVIEMGWQRVNANAGARPFHALSYRLVGGATFLQDGKEFLTVAEDEITFCPAGFDFSKQAGKGRIIAIHFLSDSPLPQTVQRFIPQNPQHFRKMFLSLATIWNEKKPGWEYESKILFYRVIRDMEQQWGTTDKTAAQQRLAGTLEYVSTHLSDPTLCVDTLAKNCSMSDTYFRKLFVQQTGVTPQQYISRLRLEKATELLHSGYYSVGEISALCGFNNSNYFSLFIKRQTGLSPMQYRKQLLNSPQP